MSIDFVGNLRERLQHDASAAESQIKRFKENAQNPNLGKQQGLIEATVINQYEAVAQQLLNAVPNDSDALAALDHVAALRQRMADAQ
jgi:hypothetical protein